MSESSFQGLLGQLRRLVAGAGGSTADSVDDRTLLGRHVAGDQEAFSALVARHADLVWGVCRRLLSEPHDAEDAFQAVFLVLVRQAGAVRWRESIAGWLHVVAVRVCRKARLAAARRQKRERDVATMPTTDTVDDAWAELRPILDEELAKLPERYRQPLVLCYLEGQSNDDAARTLGCPTGTVKSLLSRGREMLRHRLARRGCEVAGAALLQFLTNDACVRAGTTLQAVAVDVALRFAAGGAVGAPGVLAEEVLHVMLMQKVRMLSLVGVVVLLAGLSVGVAMSHPEAAEPMPVVQPDAPKPAVRLDAHGDPLPEGVVARLGTVRLRHGGSITCIEYSPDGKRIASGGHDQRVRIWDATDGKQLREFTFPQSPSTVHFSRDGKLLFVGDWGGLNKHRRDEELRCLEVATSKELYRLARYGDCLILPDGKRFLTWGWGADNIQIRDLSSGKTQKEMGEPSMRGISNPSGYASAVALSPDGRHLVTVGYGSPIIVWDFEKRKKIKEIDHKSDGVAKFNLAFSPDGKLLAAGNDKKEIHLFDVGTWKAAGKLEGFEEGPYWLRFMSDSKTLIASSMGAAVRAWNLADGKEMQKWDDLGPVLALSPDCKSLAGAPYLGHRVTIVDLVEKKVRLRSPNMGFEYGLSALAMSRDGSMAVSRDCERVIVWDPANGKTRKIIDSPCDGIVAPGLTTGSPAGFEITVSKSIHSEDTRSVGLNGDGTTLAILAGVKDKRTVQLIDSQTGKVRKSLPCAEDVQRVSLSPDGETIAVAESYLGAISLIDVASGKVRGKACDKLAGPSVFSTDGRRFAVVLRDKRLRIADVATCQKKTTLSARIENVESLAFSADDKFLAAGDTEGWVRVWELATGKVAVDREIFPKKVGKVEKSPEGLIVEFEDDRNFAIRAVAFRPGGRHLAIGGEGEAIVILDLSTGKVIRRLKGHCDTITGLSWLPDGKRLISSSEDGSALVWDLADTVRR